MLTADIERVEVRTHLLNPAEAEVWITIVPVGLPSDVEVRGRLMGPRCCYSTTVEVAYPLRPLPRRLEKSRDWTARVIIPEPSFWDPESPFLYQGPVEVWKDRRRWFEAQISHGLRVLQLGKRGLRWNGRALNVRGVSRQRLSPEDALRLRQEGYNALLAPVCAETADLWDAADRFGFLVLGRLPDSDAGLRQAESLRFHACCLGWLLPEEMVQRGAPAGTERARLQSGSGQLLGVELDRVPPDRLLQGIQFLFAQESLLPALEEVHRPVLLKLSPTAEGGEGAKQATASSGILGWIAE